jgi:arsenate reductase (thioredoxin)
MDTVLFACVHNAGRSQMAAALFNKLCDPDKATAISAGTEPGERVHHEVVEVMREEGIELGGVKPQFLSVELAKRTTLLVTMGCDQDCPYVPGLLRVDWPLQDPKGLGLEEVRRIREEIRARILSLLQERSWMSTSLRTE